MKEIDKAALEKVGGGVVEFKKPVYDPEPYCSSYEPLAGSEDDPAHCNICKFGFNGDRSCPGR